MYDVWCIMYNVYASAYACACFFLLNFTFWEETSNRMKTFPKTHQAPVLGEDRSCGLRVPPTQLGRCSTKTWGDLGGQWGDVCWRCLVWPLDVTRLLQKSMAGNRPGINHKLAHAWLQNLVRSHSLSVYIKAVPFEQSKNNKWSLLSWASCLANSQLISASLLAARPHN